MLSLALINVFVRPFGLSPWFGYNFLVFLSYFASAVGGFLLMREWTGSTRAGVWAGVFWGFLFYRVHHMSHLQILSFEWIPFCVLFLVRVAREPSLKNWLAFSFFFLLQALVSWYLAVITSFLILVVALFTVQKTMFARRSVLLACGAVVICALPLAFLAVPYAAASHLSTLPERFASAVSSGSGIHLDGYFFPPDATLIGSLVPGNRHWVWGENTLYIGYVPLLLAFVGLARERQRALRLVVLGLALVIVGAALAMGFTYGASYTKLPLYYLARVAPFLAGLRAAQRFSLLIYFGVMLLSSLAVARLDGRPGKRWVPTAVVAIACGLFLFEVFPVKLPYDGAQREFEYSVIDRGIDRIQKETGRPVAAIHLPIYYFTQSYPTSEARYMVGSTLHHAFIVNGFSGATPLGWMEDLRTYNELPDARSFALLQERQVDLICLHPELPPARAKLIVDRFRELQLGDVLHADESGNVILRLWRSPTSS